MISRLRELVDTLLYTVDNWYERTFHPPPDEPTPVRKPTATTPEPAEEIEFHPIPLFVDDVPVVCPVTRQTLSPEGRVYQCRVCGLAFSPEGWEFLKKEDRGQCCGCRSQNSIFPYNPRQSLL